MRATVRPVILCALLALGGCEGSSSPDTMNASAMEEDGTTEFCRRTGQPEAIGECARLEEQYAALDAGVDAFVPSESMREFEPTVIRYAITRLPDEVQGGGGTLAEAVDEDGGDKPEASGAFPETLPAPGATEAPRPSSDPEGPTQAEIDQALAMAQQDVAAAVAPPDTGDEVTTRLIKMGRRMQACLSADDSFTLEGARCQVIDTFEQPVATWRWTVTPTRPGSHTLQVNSSVALLASDGSPRMIPQRGQNAAIAVEVTAYGRWRRGLDTAERWATSPLGLLAALTTLAGAIGLLIGAVKRARRGEGPKGG